MVGDVNGPGQRLPRGREGEDGGDSMRVRIFAAIRSRMFKFWKKKPADVAPPQATEIDSAALAADAGGIALRWDGDRDFGHVLPTLDAGVDCVAGGSSGRKKPASVRLSPKNTVCENVACAKAGAAASARAQRAAQWRRVCCMGRSRSGLQGRALQRGLDAFERAAADRPAFDHSIAALTARGVDPDPTALWDDYRVGALSGYFMAVFASMNVERTERGDEMFAVMAERPARQALALGSLGLL